MSFKDDELIVLLEEIGENEITQWSAGHVRGKEI